MRGKRRLGNALVRRVQRHMNMTALFRQVEDFPDLGTSSFASRSGIAAIQAGRDTAQPVYASYWPGVQAYTPAAPAWQADSPVSEFQTPQPRALGAPVQTGPVSAPVFPAQAPAVPGRPAGPASAAAPRPPVASNVPAAPQPVQRFPDPAAPQPVQRLPDQAAPQPVQRFPDPAAPQPVQRFPDQAAPQPVQRFPDQAAPQTVQRFPDQAAPQPVQRLPDPAAPQPVQRFPDQAAPQPVQRFPDPVIPQPGVVTPAVGAGYREEPKEGLSDTDWRRLQAISEAHRRRQQEQASSVPPENATPAPASTAAQPAQAVQRRPDADAARPGRPLQAGQPPVAPPAGRGRSQVTYISPPEASPPLTPAQPAEQSFIQREPAGEGAAGQGSPGPEPSQQLQTALQDMSQRLVSLQEKQAPASGAADGSAAGAGTGATPGAGSPEQQSAQSAESGPGAGDQAQQAPGQAPLDVNQIVAVAETVLGDMIQSSAQAATDTPASQAADLANKVADAASQPQQAGQSASVQMKPDLSAPSPALIPPVERAQPGDVLQRHVDGDQTSVDQVAGGFPAAPQTPAVPAPAPPSQAPPTQVHSPGPADAPVEERAVQRHAADAQPLAPAPMPASEAADAYAAADANATQILPRPVPLEMVWPVQRQASEPLRPVQRQAVPEPTRPAPSVTPAAPPTSPTGVAEGLEGDENLRQVLQRVPAGQPTDSSIEVIGPRRPRPAAPPSAPASTPVLQRQAAEPQLVPTEIGNLPADLWRLVGEKPPATPAPQTASVEGSPAPRTAVSAPKIGEAARPEAYSSETVAPAQLVQRSIEQPQVARLQRFSPEAPAAAPALAPAVSRAERTSEPPPAAVQPAPLVETIIQRVPDNTASGQAGEGQAAGQGDMNVDELARRVYAEVRRKLTVELERMRRR